MQQLFDLREFFISGTNPNTSHVLLSIVEPSTPEEIRRGYMFTIAELTNCSVPEIKRIQEEVDSMQETFYRQPLSSKDSPLELILEKANSRAHILRPAHGTLFWTVGALNNERIDLAFCGKALCFMLFNHKNSTDRVSLSDTENVSTEHLFHNMLTGEIHQGDVFVCTTYNTQKHLSEERIEKILSARPPRNAAAHIQNTLEPLGKGEGFAGIIIRSIPDKELPKTGPIPPYLKGNPVGSLSKLAENETTTRNTLFPPLIGRLRAAIQAKQEDQNKEKESTTVPVRMSAGSPNAPEGTLNAIGLVIGKIIVRVLQTLFFVGKLLIIALSRISITFIILVTNRGGGRTALIQSYRSYISYIGNTLRSLSLVQKTIIGACIIFLLGGVITTIYAHQKRIQGNIQAAQAAEIERIKEYISYAEAQKIINNDAVAIEALHNAETALSTIQSGQKTIPPEQSLLGEHINALMRDLRKIRKIDMRLIVHTSSTVPLQLGTYQNSIVVFSDNPDVGIYNTLSTGFSWHTQSILPHIRAFTSPKEQDYAAAISKTGFAAFVDITNGTLTEKTIDYPISAEQRLIIDAVMYNRNLYTLDSASRMIYKHGPTQLGFEKGVSWVTEGASAITSPTSLAVDGDIYVTNNDGTLVKYSSGKAAMFTLSGIDPKPTSLNKVRTHSDTNRIYVLDTSIKRIIVLDKNGNLIAQLTSEQWQEPTDFIVDEKKKIIYVTDNGSLYSADLPI